MPPPKKRRASPDSGGDDIQEIRNELKDIKHELNEMSSIKPRIDTLHDAQEKMAREQHEMFDKLRNQIAEQKTPIFPPIKKIIQMEHPIRNVSGILNGTSIDSDKQHFHGLDWHVQLKRKEDDTIGCYLFCSNPNLENDWSVKTRYTLRIEEPYKLTFDDHVFMKANSKLGHGEANFIKREKMLKAVPGDVLTVWVGVVIFKMTGVLKPRSFDENHMPLANARIAINEEGFYFRKEFLANKSPVFRDMLSEDPEKYDFTLNGWQPVHFRTFLEVLHGQHTLEDQNVSCVLDISKEYKAADAVTSCEKFLLFESNLPHDEKLNIALRHDLSKLTEKCIMEITTVEEIRAVSDREMSGDARKMLLGRMFVLYDEKKAVSN